MYLVIVKMKPLPAKRKELIQTLSSIRKEIQQKQGYLQAGIYQDVEDETSILLFQEWANHESAEAMLCSDLITVLRGAGSLMCQPPEFLSLVAGAVSMAEVKSWELLYQNKEENDETNIC